MRRKLLIVGYNEHGLGEVKSCTLTCMICGAPFVANETNSPVSAISELARHWCIDPAIAFEFAAHAFFNDDGCETDCYVPGTYIKTNYADRLLNAVSLQAQLS